MKICIMLNISGVSSVMLFLNFILKFYFNFNCDEHCNLILW